MLHCSSFTLKRSFPFFFCECQPFRWLSVQLTKSKLAFIQLQSKYAPWFSRILELPCSCPHEVNIGTVLVILQHKLSIRPSLMKPTTHEINSHQINFPDDQLLIQDQLSPGDQLPPDQLFPWLQLLMRSTSHEFNYHQINFSHEINFQWDQLPMRSTFHEYNFPRDQLPMRSTSYKINFPWDQPFMNLTHIMHFPNFTAFGMLN